MKKIRALWVIFPTFAMTIGCSSMTPAEFASNRPEFKLESYFSGKRLGQGIFFDRFGRARVSFTAALDGRVDGERFIIDELLTYSTGEKIERRYEIKKLPNNSYSLESPDLAEPGTIEQSGNVLQWRYRLKQEINGSIWTLKFDDWMFLQPDGQTVLNRAKATKFGLDVGEVLMSVQ